MSILLDSLGYGRGLHEGGLRGISLTWTGRVEGKKCTSGGNDRSESKSLVICAEWMWEQTV